MDKSIKHWLSIKVKITVLLIMSIILLVASVMAVSYTILQRAYNQIEEDSVDHALERVENTFSSEFSHLKVTLVDWAQWDESYDFVQGNNPEYIVDNLTDGTLVNLGLTVLIFTDNEGRLIFKKVVDQETESEVETEDISARVLAQSNLVEHLGDENLVSGFLQLPEGLLAVVSAPVLNNDADQPAKGTLVFGVLFDDDKISKIEELTDVTIDIYPFSTEVQPADVQEARVGLNGDEANFFIQPLSSDIIAGYMLLYDVSNNPFAVLKVETARTVHKQAMDTMTISFFLTLGLILAIGLVTNFLLHKFLVERVTRLSSEVDKITKLKDLSRKVYEGTQDEVGTLATGINSMLSALAEATMSENKLRKLEEETAQKLRNEMEEAKSLNKIMVGRELKMVELKSRIKELEEQLDNRK